MTPNFQRIKDALTQHCLDSLGNIYTITVDDVVDYIEKELSPAMTVQLAALDEVSLAIEIADAIGNAGPNSLWFKQVTVYPNPNSSANNGTYVSD